MVVLAALGAAALAIGGAGGVIVRDDSGCPRSLGSLGAVSWTDVLRVRDVTYARIESRPVVPRAKIGPQVGEVRCTMADVQHPGYELANGDATFLPTGTPIHALRGVHGAFRVVVLEGELPVVYQRDVVADASVGADVYPFPSTDVDRITFLSPRDGTTRTGGITDPDQTRAFVEGLMRAPVDADAVGTLPEGPRVFVALEFADQPPVTVVVYPEQGLTTDGLQLPPSVLDALPPPS